MTGVVTLGISYLITNDNPFYFKDGNIIWMKSKGISNYEYVNYLFSTNYLKNQIANDSGATVGTFTITKAKKALIILPPRETQDKFTDFLIEARKIKMVLSRDIEDLEKLLKTKMHEYFD